MNEQKDHRGWRGAACLRRGAAAISAAVLFSSCSLGHTALQEGRARPVANAAFVGTEGPRELIWPIKLLTLNIAHGRRDGLNQVLQRGETIRGNIRNAADVLKRVGADVVALQEADGPSRWSGNFDHVAALAGYADYAWYALGEHANSWLFTYGTALLSRVPFEEVLSHAFRPTPPTMTKGFLLGQVLVRAESGSRTVFIVDILSVHLDFSRRAVRKEQIDEIVSVLSSRSNPVIVLGDFNSEWPAEDSAVERIARLRGLHAYRPTADDLGTYRSNSRRYDWILISRDLEFRSYTVLSDDLSDHSPVVAEVTMRTDRAGD